MNRLNITVEEKHAGKRADVFLSENMENTSRSAASHLLEKGAVTLSGRLLKKSDKVVPGGVVAVLLPESVPSAIVPADIPLDILYEDEDLLVINKPKGLVVHPGAGNTQNTLVSALLHHCQGQLSGINGVMRPGIVHRLDKETSGLLVAAKNDRAHLGLSAQLQNRTMLRKYEAVVFGTPKEISGKIDRPIGRHPKDRKKMAVVPGGRQAVTHYEIIGVYPGNGVSFSHMALRLETGRTHQIRVHMASIGHPVAGDAVYGSPERDKRFFPFLEGQCLHAKYLSFIHPVTKTQIALESPLPADFLQVLEKLSSL